MRVAARCRPCARRPRRRAYILIVVLGLATVVATLGISFLEANSTAMPEAHNRFRAVRAQYLAESGVDIATHFLMYAPNSVSDGDYWRGESGIAIDSTSDYCSVAVTRDSTNLDLYYVASLGIARDYDGSIRGKRRISAEVLAPREPTWDIPHALTGDLSSLPSSGLSVTGSTCNTVASTACLLPSTQVSTYYTRYRHGNRVYNSYFLNRTSLSNTNAVTLNDVDMSSINPGRVIYTPGNLTITDDVDFEGTLVVPGNLIVSANASLRVEPKAGFPALIVAGDISMGGILGSRAELRALGAVVCEGYLSGPALSLLSEVRAEVSGAFVLKRGFHSSILNFSSRDIRINWDSTLSKFKDFETRWPVTILSWKEE